MGNIWIGTDMELSLSALTDAITSTVVNSATVAAQLTDAVTGANIGTSVSLASAGSGGNYTGLLPNSTTSSLVSGQALYLTTIATYSGYEFKDRQIYVAAYAGT